MERLFAAGCGLVVLACNTASAVALHDLQVNWLNPATHRVLGVFVPVIEHLTRRDWGDNTPPTHTGLRDVALFATPATVRSGAFPRELRFRARDVTVVPQACTGLVEAIEAGDLDRAGDGGPRACGGAARPAAGAAVGGARLHPLPAGRGGVPRGAAAGDRRSSRSRRWSPPASRTTSGATRASAAAPARVSYLTTGDPAAVGARAAVFTGARCPSAARDRGALIAAPPLP